MSEIYTLKTLKRVKQKESPQKELGLRLMAVDSIDHPEKTLNF